MYKQKINKTDVLFTSSLSMRTSHSLSMTTPSAGEWSKRWKPASISCFKSCPCIFSWLHTNNIVSWTGQFKTELGSTNVIVLWTGQNRTWLHKNDIGLWQDRTELGCTHDIVYEQDRTELCFTHDIVLWTGQNKTWLHKWRCFMNRTEQNFVAQMTLFYEQTELSMTAQIT